MRILRHRPGPQPPARRAADGSPLDVTSERIARGLANRFTRRSFLGDVGKGGVALALGGTMAGVAGVEPALASHCGGCASCPGQSIRCDNLAGHGNGCPGNSCACGHWCSTNGPCSGQTRWIDCCRGCDGPGRCAHGFEGNCQASCCNPKQWSGGCDSGRIKCRIWRCDGC